LEDVERPVRVLVAAPSGLERDAIRHSLDSPDFALLGEASTADEIVATALEWSPEICLVDVALPGNWAAAVEHLTRALPDISIVVLADDDDDLIQALQAGAIGYLPKSMDTSRLGAALIGVLRGEAALPRPLVARLIDEFQMRETRRRSPVFGGRHVSLTPREWEILELLRAGRTTREIAAELFVAEVTVRTHVAAILRKLSVRTRREALDLIESSRPRRRRRPEGST
jgi:DNA-binding NarL/FixJ family response regulator